MIKKLDERHGFHMDSLFQDLVRCYYDMYPDTPDLSVEITLTDNLNSTHAQLRPDIKQELLADNPQNDFNGRMVVPISLDDPIHILLNTSKIKEYTDDGSMTWIGTFAHEYTHAIDFFQMARLEGLTTYGPLERANQYLMFQLWTEYHARKRGYRFLRQLHSNAGRIPPETDAQISYITETEWPFHNRRFYQEYHADRNGKEQMYLTMQLLGRYSVWADLFPDCFNENSLSLDFYGTDWMVDLFRFLRSHESINEVYLAFDKLEEVFRENWPI